MAKIIVQRLLLGLLTILAVSVVVFTATELLPGDVAQAILGNTATEETLRALRASLNLDQPGVVRYFNWLQGLLTMDMGESLSSGRPVADLIGDRLMNTLFLSFWASLFAVPLALGLGLLSAMFPGSIFDRLTQVGSLVSISFPEFFVGSILVLIFAVNLGWFPAISRISDDMNLLQKLHTLALPILTLTAVVLAYMMRMTRTAILNVLKSPFVEMALLKGVPNCRLIWHHALPNALAPIINVVALSLAYLVVGVIVVEVLFSYDGIGQLLVDGVSKRDIPLVQACAMFFALTYVVLNLAADLFSVVANPRLRYPK